MKMEPSSVLLLALLMHSNAWQVPTTNLEVWIESPEGFVKEGDTVEIRCHGDGMPPPKLIFNRENSDEELESSDGLLVLKEVSRADSGVYECRSLDHELMGSLQLTVHYLDQAEVTPKDIVTLKGESLTIFCNAQSSLENFTVWFKDGVEFGRGDNLSLEDATFDTGGRYDCEVTVPSVPGLQTNASVYVSVQGMPEMQAVERQGQVAGFVGEWVNLSCEVRGFPKPIFTWIIIGDEPISWRGDVVKEGENLFRSVVTINVSKDTIVACDSTNDFGTVIQTYSIEKDNTTKVIVTVAMMGVFVLALLGCIFGSPYDKSKKPELKKGCYVFEKPAIMSDADD